METVASIAMTTPYSPEELDYFREHKSDSKVTLVIVSATISALGTTLVVVLRLLSCWLFNGRLKLGVSDWLVLVAWTFNLLFATTLAISTRWGLGRHVLYATDPKLLSYSSTIDEVSYFVSMSFLKLSILSLYGSIFPVRRFHYWLWAVGALVSAWGIESTFASIFQCTPVSYRNYQKYSGISGHCIDYALFSLVTSIINTITDLVILLMPMPLVWKLRMPRREKWLVFATFAVGCSACIIGIVRIPYNSKFGTSDGPWVSIEPDLVTMAEPAVGILSVTIPRLRPLYYWFAPPKSKPSYSFASRYARAPRVGGRLNDCLDTTCEGTKVSSPDLLQHDGIGTLYGRSTHTAKIETDVEASAGAIGVAGIHVTDQIELIRYTQRNGVWIPEDERNESV
ncbi:hypothetical protein GGR58DRAFT_490195 [Xylaria digitata]|nr:hypothetical protein GGR58DRAFT_490195 [Xylaria digitata]